MNRGMLPAGSGRPKAAINTLQVADLAHRAGVTPAAVRYYARIGLLHPYRDHENGYRKFSSEDLRRVVFIRKAQALGLTIGDIRLIFEKLERGLPPCHLVVELVEHRLEEIQSQCAALEATGARISSALAQWSIDEQRRHEPGELCPLIEEVELEDSVSLFEASGKFRLVIANGVRERDVNTRE